MLYTAAPSTCPTGSNPVLLMATNSSALSADDQVPLSRISAIRASAAGGSSRSGSSTVTLRPLVALSAAGLTLQDRGSRGPAAAATDRRPPQLSGLARPICPASRGYQLSAASPGHRSWASHSLLRRSTVSRQCSAASLVGYGPSRSLPAQPGPCSTSWCLRQNHQLLSSSMSLRLADHVCDPPAWPGFARAKCAGRHPPPRVRRPPRTTRWRA